jgi:hypothetical protein
LFVTVLHKKHPKSFVSNFWGAVHFHISGSLFLSYTNTVLFSIRTFSFLFAARFRIVAFFLWTIFVWAISLSLRAFGF